MILSTHGPISVIRHRNGLSVEHEKTCGACDGIGSTCLGFSGPFRESSDDCDRCRGAGVVADADCDCATCQALAVKHDLMLGEDASPEAIALLEAWAAELCAKTLELAEAA